MSSRQRFVLAPVALGLAVLLASGAVRSQDYNPSVPPGYGQPGYLQQDPADANVLGNPDAMAADPSSRIATVTDMAGGLSFAPAGSDEWAAVGPNRPITTGDRLWVAPGGRAELHAGTTAVRLGGATAATILNLDDRSTQVKLTQGTLQLRVRALPPDQQVEVDTPNLAFVPREPGDYRLDVSPDGTTTLVTMRHGSAVLYGDSRSIELSRGQRMRFAGSDLADAGPGNYPPPDGFDQWIAARDAREDASVSARYVPPDMTGYTALDDYGDWQQDPGYGAVWFPRAMPSGWAPYSAGHWAWVAPWGWTWIDDAPWGFAPSHYGRWAYFGSRWGWVPGPVAVRPCYAPAVVGFIGGAAATIRIGGGPGVAWYPLGPRDTYRPIYRASPRYVTRINNFPVNNTWTHGGDRDRWVNRNVPGAISGMPSRSFVEGRAVPRDSHRDEWRHLPVGEGRGGPPMAPVKNSLIGGARPQGLPPTARQGFDRQVIAAHPPGRVGPDELARRFAREGGTAGAGPAWRGPTPGADGRDRGQQARQDGRRGPQPVQAMPWQPDVRMSQAAQGAQNGRGQGQRPEQMRGLPPEAERQQQSLQRQQFEQQRQLQDQQRQSADFQQRQQQALQRQRDDQQRQFQEQQRQSQDMQRRQQSDQQRMIQEQRQQQFEQQRQAQERQQMDVQRQAQQRQQQFDQQRQAQERQQMDVQRQAQQRQQQFEQQRQAQDQQRQQMEQQRQQAAQRQQLEQARQFQEQQRQQFEQQRQHAMQRQQMEQQRQAQEQQRHFQEQQQQQQRQAQEQQRQMQQQQQQQQERQRQFQQQQQQQQQQQRAQQEQRHGQQARNDDRR